MDSGLSQWLGDEAPLPHDTTLQRLETLWKQRPLYQVSGAMGENHARRDPWPARLTGSPSMPPDWCCCNSATTGCMHATGLPTGGDLNESASCWLLGPAIVFGQNGRVPARAVRPCPKTRQSIVCLASVESSLRQKPGPRAPWPLPLNIGNRRLLQSKTLGVGPRSRTGWNPRHVAIGLFALSCLSCGGDGSGLVPTQQVGSIIIDVPPSQFERGTKKKFNATVNDIHGKVIDVPVVWQSSQVGVGVFDANGVFTALDTGTTIVTATSLGTSSGQLPIQVVW